MHVLAVYQRGVCKTIQIQLRNQITFLANYRVLGFLLKVHYKLLAIN